MEFSKEFTPGPWRASMLLTDGVIIKKGPYWQIDTRDYDVATWVEKGAPIRKRADAILMANAPDMYKALVEIAKGQGAFSRDPLTHAANTIDAMKEVAQELLDKLEKEWTGT